MKQLVLINYRLLGQCIVSALGAGMWIWYRCDIRPGGNMKRMRHFDNISVLLHTSRTDDRL